MMYQDWNVIPSRYEWGKGQGDNVDPKEKILAEIAGLHLFSQVLVSCGDDSYIYGD